MMMMCVGVVRLRVPSPPDVVFRGRLYLVSSIVRHNCLPRATLRCRQEAGLDDEEGKRLAVDGPARDGSNSP